MRHGGNLVWDGVLRVTGMGPDQGASMTKWWVELDGRKRGTVYADTEHEAKIEAEDKFGLTDEEGDRLVVYEAD